MDSPVNITKLQMNRPNYPKMIEEIKDEINKNAQPLISPNTEWWYWKGANDLGDMINYIIDKYSKEDKS